jgi:hypothetical protein
VEIVVAIASSILGVLTFLLVWGLLPLWLFAFDWLTLNRYARRPENIRRRLMLAGFATSAAMLLLLWHFVLPDWWIASTPMLSYG